MANRLAPSESGKSGEAVRELKTPSVGALVTAITGLLATLGFLATRAYVNSLGLPVHVAIPVESYSQYGGRFLFTLVVHGAIIATVLALLIVLLRRLRFLYRLAEARYRWLAFGFLGIATLATELVLLQGQTTVFIAGTALPESPAATPMQMVALLAVEALVLLTVWFAFERLYYVQTEMAQSPVLRKAAQSYVSVLCLAAVLLLPILFAGTAMRDDRFRQIALLDEDGTVVAQGIHAFTDAEDHFVWDAVNKHLIQVSKHSIVMVKHLGESGG